MAEENKKMSPEEIVKKNRDQYVERLEATLPENLKGKGPALVDMLDAFFAEGLGLVERIEAEPEFIPILKKEAIRRLGVLFAVNTFKREGAHGILELARQANSAIDFERNQKIMEAMSKQNEKRIITPNLGVVK